MPACHKDDLQVKPRSLIAIPVDFRAKLGMLHMFLVRVLILLLGDLRAFDHRGTKSEFLSLSALSEFMFVSQLV